ncbi:MAG: hypothetical protein KDB53_18185, partial [Planctomycetes bacterium]|nr:hypothetical protein [Planctomycetota bacterium]
MHPSTRLAWFAIPLLCSLLSAQGFQFTSFANTAGLSLVGSASPSSNRIRLTDLLANQTGAMWHATPQPISAGFDSTFSFRISPPISGIAAAGMAFVIHDAPAGNMSLGGSAWGLGYGSGASGTALPKSIAIEIDT